MKHKGIYLLLMVLIIQIIKAQNTDSYWCWTKPVEAKLAKNFDPKNGGPNWGYCSSPEEAMNEKQTYGVTVVTSNIEGAGAKGSFFIQLYGNEGRTDEVLITSDGFEQGSTVKQDIEAPRIGDPFKIKLRYTGNDDFRCSHIKVSQGAKFWEFDCGQWLQCPKQCSEIMPLAGRTVYEVEVKTRSNIGAGTKAPLFIQILGSDGDTVKKVLCEDGYQAGETEKVEITGKDIGNICGVKISMTNHEQWSPESIKIVKKGGGVQEYKDLRVSIMCPVTCEIKLKNKCGPDSSVSAGPSKPKKPQKKPKAKSEKDTSDNQEEETEDEKEEEGSNDGDMIMNNYQGMGLSDMERSKIISATCDTIIKDDEDFGQSFQDNRINHNLYLVRCPSGCDNTGDTKALGLGIHPEDASVCKSAIADGALSIVGGIVGIGTYVGISNYDASKGKINGMEVGQAKASSKSFSTVKIDNIDMCDLDMRILNYQNQPDYMGRVEFRLDGKWGSICAKGMSQSAARRICRDLKYKDGRMLNPDGAEGFCKTLQGENYCGNAIQPIHFQAINCEGTEANIMQCTRELALDKCGHLDDVIVECSMINFDVEQEPAPKTIRLMDDKGSASSSGSGRLEIYMGKWGTICNYDFDDNSAKVACIQMGYEGGKIIGNVGEQGVCANFNEKNYCGNGPIQMVHVKCKGDENLIEKCSYKTWPFVWRCAHDYDIIVTCDGLKGDPSGKSQQKQIPAMPPKLGKLPLVPIIKGNCQMTLMEKIFKGDPGSVFLVHCPKSCLEMNDQSSVYGTAIYSQESAICKAAIHAGVVQHFGGLVEVVISWGQSIYVGSLNRDIESYDYPASVRAFTVIKPNSLHIRLAQSFQGREQVKSCKTCSWEKSSFFQKSYSINYNNNSKSSQLLKLQSVLDHDLNILQPTFNLTKQLTNKQFKFQNYHFPQFLESNSEMERYLRNPDDYLQNKKIKKQGKLKKYRLKYSFLQSKSKTNLQNQNKNKKDKKKDENAPLFSWWPEPNFEFHGKETDILTDLASIDGESKTGTLKEFSIAIAFKQKQESDSEMTLVSHSNCGCYALTITSDHQIVFKQRCGQDFIFNSNYFIAIKEQYSLVLTTESSKTTFFINGDMYNYVDKGMRFTCERHLDIGSFSEQKNQIFNGVIDYVHIYDRIIGQDEITKLHKDGSEKPYNQGIVKGIRKTRDGRLCKGQCTDNPFPGAPGAPSPPSGTLLGQPETPDPSEKKDDQGSTSTNPENDEGMDENIPIPDTQQQSEEAVESAAATGISCKIQGTNKMFDGPTGKKFRVNCPKACGQNEGLVIGTMIYHDDSYVCKAAIHSGVIDENGGDLILTIGNGQQFYPNSKQNGIQSANREEGTKSMVFTKAQKVIKIKCDTTAQDVVFNGPVGTKVTVGCPANCTDIPLNIFGTKIYSEDSSVCQAAIHIGAILDEGGETQLEIEKGLPLYKGSNSNGISSVDKLTFQRSFFFIGVMNSANLCQFFKENYSPPDIYKNYLVQDFVGAIRTPSIWSFNNHPEKKGLLVFEQISTIQGNSAYFGTYLLRKNFNCPNGLIKFNMFYKTVGRAALLFRYRDMDKYLALEFNAKEAPVRLIKKQGQSVEEIMVSYNYQLVPRTWYRWRIYYNQRTIKVYYQNHNIRKVFKLFQINDDEDPWRGTVGFATDSSDQTYFDGLQVEAADDTYLEKGEKLEYQRSWSICLGSDNKGKIEKFCKDFYGSYKEPIMKCRELHKFCYTCCDKYVSRLENIMNFQCVRNCIQNAKDKEKEAEKGEGGLPVQEIFKADQKIDFKPEDTEESQFLPGKIKEVKDKDPQNIIYSVENEDGEIIDNLKPSQIQKCGIALKERQDCF